MKKNMRHFQEILASLKTEHSVDGPILAIDFYGEHRFILYTPKQKIYLLDEQLLKIENRSK